MSYELRSPGAKRNLLQGIEVKEWDHLSVISPVSGPQSSVFLLPATSYELPASFAAFGRKSPPFCRFCRLEIPPVVCYPLNKLEHVFCFRLHPQRKDG